MQVTLDISPAINGKAGLGRYAASLAAALAAERPGAVRLFANQTSSAREVPELAGLPIRTVRAGYKPWRMGVYAAQIAHVPFNRWVGPCDLFHATEHLLVPVHGAPSVLTIHDLIFELFPEHHKGLNKAYLTRALPLFARRAQHVITVSEQSKADIMRLYGVPEARISVIYEAAAPHFKPQPPEAVAGVRARYALPERYLVTLGTIEPRKNLPRLVEALAALRANHPDLALVVIGAEGWLTGGFFEALARFGQQDAVIRPGYVPDADLPAMLAGALAAAQPSLYEGFGLPVLEAMACGTPVACSSTSSLGEVAGEAALTFDPTDTGALVAALRALVEQPTLRAELRTRGLARAAQFSWARAASETWAVYEALARP